MSKEMQGYMPYSTVHTVHTCTRTYSTGAVSDFPNRASYGLLTGRQDGSWECWATVRTVYICSVVAVP